MHARFAIALFLTLTVGCGAGEVDDGGGGNDGGGGGVADSGGGGGLEDMLTSLEIELLDTINAERASMGLTQVTLRETLICAAKRHSMDVGAVGSCSHDGTDGSDPTIRVQDCGGGGWSGEIIACGQGTPRSAVDAWIGSPGHNAIMFGASKREIGVAMHNNYWTAIFDD